MNLHIADQHFRGQQLLQSLAYRPVMPCNPALLKEKYARIELPGTTLTDINTVAFWQYQIFPPGILTVLAQWQVEQRDMRVGDTILQQVHLPPSKTFSVKMIFGVRIGAVVREPRRAAFTYQTLEGHVERGESTFMLEETAGGVCFSILTRSEPANIFLKWLAPLAASPYQDYCTRRALHHASTNLRQPTV